MVDFGWSFPPGCTSVPGDEPVWCEVCGGCEDDCVCPECPVCKIYGNPECYLGRKSWWTSWDRKYHGTGKNKLQKFFGHGLIRLPQQRKLWRVMEEARQAEAEAWIAENPDEFN